MYASIMPVGCPAQNTGESANWSVKPFGCAPGSSAWFSVKPFGYSAESANWNVRPFNGPVRAKRRGKPVYNFAGDMADSSAFFSIKPFDKFPGNVSRIRTVGAPQVGPLVAEGTAVAGTVAGSVFGGPVGGAVGGALGSILGSLVGSLFGTTTMSSAQRELLANNPACAEQNFQIIEQAVQQFHAQIDSMVSQIKQLNAAQQDPTASFYQFAINGCELLYAFFEATQMNEPEILIQNCSGISNGDQARSDMAGLVPYFQQALAGAGAPAAVMAIINGLPSFDVGNFHTGGGPAFLAALSNAVVSLQTTLQGLPTATEATTTASTVPTSAASTNPNVTATTDPTSGVVTATDNATGKQVQFASATVYQTALTYAATTATPIENSPYALAPIAANGVVVTENPATGVVTVTNTATNSTQTYPTVAAYQAAVSGSGYGVQLSTNSSYLTALENPNTGEVMVRNSETGAEQIYASLAAWEAATGGTTSSAYYSGAGAATTGSGYSDIWGSGSGYGGGNAGTSYAAQQQALAAQQAAIAAQASTASSSSTSNILIIGGVMLGAYLLLRGGGHTVRRHTSRRPREMVEMVPEPQPMMEPEYVE